MISYSVCIFVFISNFNKNDCVLAKVLIVEIKHQIMGSEHSTHIKVQAGLNQQSGKQTNLHRQHTIANPGAGCDLEERPGSTSPGPSICSDSDLPYISYTVNRPIGDSPKLTNKQLTKSKSSSQRKPVQKNIKKSAHNIVVVKPAASGPNLDKDPDILRLAVKTYFLLSQFFFNV